MSCNHDCNQGRRCQCRRELRLIEVIAALVAVTALIAGIAAFFN